MKRGLLLFLACVLMCSKLCAQEILTEDFTLTKPVSVVGFGEEKIQLDPKKDKATLKFFTFDDDDCFCYEICVEGPTVREAVKGLADFPDGKVHCTWTGSTNRINAAHLTEDQNTYCVIDTYGAFDGLFGEYDGSWVVMLDENIDYAVCDIYTGMTKQQVTKKLTKSLGNLITLKPNGRVKGLTKYTVYSYQLNRSIIHPIFDFLSKDAPYAHFFFDANNKLVKWYLAF